MPLSAPLRSSPVSAFASLAVRRSRRSPVSPFASFAVRQFRRSPVSAFASLAVRRSRRSPVSPFASFAVRQFRPSAFSFPPISMKSSSPSWIAAFLSLACACSPPQSSAQPSVPAVQPSAPPKLIVLITIDQMRADYLDKWSSQFTGGLARLTKNGAVFTNAFQDHANSETAPGHATLLSGREPYRTGIVFNTEGVPDRGLADHRRRRPGRVAVSIQGVDAVRLAQKPRLALARALGLEKRPRRDSADRPLAPVGVLVPERRTLLDQQLLRR